MEIGGWAEVNPIAAVATVTVLLLALFIRAKLSPRHRLPPGPRGWPVLGCLPLLGTLPNESLFKLSKKYGPLMFMHLGSVKTLVVTSPQLAAEILKTHDHIMASRPLPIAPKYISYNAADIAFRSYGPIWRYLRKVCTVGLLTGQRIAQFQEVREREVMAALYHILDESEEGNVVNMTQCFSTIGLNNITQMLMNKSYSVLQRSGYESAEPPSMATSVAETLKESLTLLGTFNIADYVPILKPFDPQGVFKRTKAVHRKLDQFLEDIVQEHRQRPSNARGENYKEDFVDALLGIGHTKEFEESLSMDVIKALILDVVTAAGDTSALTTLWVLTELIRHPLMLKRVQEELDSVVGVDRLVREEDLPELKYLDAVVRETLRLHSPSPMLVPHKSTQDCEIAGYHIPAGTQVYVNIWGIHRDPTVWKNPLDFNPDRFLNSAIDIRGQDFSFLPFGSGRRVCPGINLGLLMVLYPLAVLLHALDWILPEGQKPEDVDVSKTFGLVLYKRLPLKVFGKARLPDHVIYSDYKVQN